MQLCGYEDYGIEHPMAAIDELDRLVLDVLAKAECGLDLLGMWENDPGGRARVIQHVVSDHPEALGADSVQPLGGLWLVFEHSDQVMHCISKFQTAAEQCHVLRVLAGRDPDDENYLYHRRRDLSSPS